MRGSLWQHSARRSYSPQRRLARFEVPWVLSRGPLVEEPCRQPLGRQGGQRRTRRAAARSLTVRRRMRLGPPRPRLRHSLRGSPSRSKLPHASPRSLLRKGLLLHPQAGPNLQVARPSSSSSRRRIAAVTRRTAGELPPRPECPLLRQNLWAKVPRAERTRGSQRREQHPR